MVADITSSCAEKSNNLKDIHPIARSLNDAIESSSSVTLQLLSEVGHRSYYPKDGIPAQAAYAGNMGVSINGTVGMSCEESGNIMHLSCLHKHISSMDPNEVFPYANAWGVPKLRNLWKELMLQKNQELKDNEISTPVVVAGLTHALYILSRLFCNTGDTVLIPDVAWDNYELIFGNQSGASIVKYRLLSNNRMDMMELIKETRKLDRNQRAIIILNIPNNPTGYTPDSDEAKALVIALETLAQEGRKLLIICDDAYVGLSYDEKAIKSSIFAYLYNIHENILVAKVDGVSKEDFSWGLRVGFLTFGIKYGTQLMYESLNNKVGAIIRATVASVNHASQSMLIKAFQDIDYEKEKKEKFVILQTKYKQVIKSLQGNLDFHKHFITIPFNSGYFLSIKPRKFAVDSLRLILAREYKVGVVTIGDLIRICYARLSLSEIDKLFSIFTMAAEEMNEYDAHRVNSS